MTIELALPRDEAIHMLGTWGYLSANSVAGLLRGTSKDDLLQGAIVEFKARWGGKYKLSSDDALDEGTAALMKRRFCNCPDDPQAVSASLRRWDSNRVTWCGDVRVGNHDFPAAQRFTRDETAAACAMQLVIRGTGAGRCNIQADEGDIDGPGGILAQAFLPGFPSSTATDSLGQEYDTADAGLSANAFQIVVLHETGHSLGLSHDEDPNQVAVMDPFLNESLTGWLPPDVAELQARYGAPGADGPGDDPGDDPLERMCPELFGITRAVMRAAERGAIRSRR